ncbi:DUF2752 domain-containing protein [Novipirellula galeiformis]|nr:DUF2752 domain-containing protein [Novipirellula galeiformis]
MRLIFGIRCPACGMTTSWSYFTRGQWLDSVQVNSGGFLLALVACLGVVLSVICLVKPGVDLMRYQKVAGITALCIALVTFVDWAVRLYQ